MCCEENNFTSLTNYSVRYQGREDNNCPDSVMTFQTFKSVDRTVCCGLIPCLFVVGVPANILNMIIFYRQGLRDRMNLCLFCLAFIDLMFLIVLIIGVSFCFIGFFLPKQEQFWRWILTRHTVNFAYGFVHSSGCLTMIIAVERWVCVMFPMKAATLISRKTMAIIVSLTLLLMQLLCGVYIVKEHILSVKDEVTGEYLVVSVLTDLYLSYSFFRIIENVVLSFISFFTFACVLLATAATVIQLHTAQSWRKSTASSHMKGQGMLMRMLVAMSCVYILCTAPNMALGLARFTVPEFRADGSFCNLFIATHMLSVLIIMFNSSINFFVYAAMSSRFRQELKALFSWTEAGMSLKTSISVTHIKHSSDSL
ncbi:uncharacterized protein LOC112570449 [Pomacea canaliculata]|uniref:uncharacterized protein LOC112570449 n=1 Tax=Pomacea canaliculata TaxID=400727 RepID=UPI000D73762C|nr:uncharacterized protein LOC112570449 [Pomacea canaliculata]